MKRKVVVFSICLVIAFSAALMTIRMTSGVQVIVRNVGNSPLQNVIVHVTGNDYELGTINAESDARVKVEPIGESHVEISFVDSNGDSKRLEVDCYFERRHYSGTITVDVEDMKLMRVEDNVTIGVY